MLEKDELIASVWAIRDCNGYYRKKLIGKRPHLINGKY